ncbi:single-stranded-DNA-specific exonuclease RecJ [candidate division KSB1 bacterium]|nr:MAG: single-stranded-DNA-specific exonuclease RecJ [candidate division KSB1 bacterium]
MRLPRTKWKILNTDPSRSIVEVILDNRKLPPSHLETFRLSERMHDPYLLPDMEKGVQRILQAIEQREKIVVFGDYDVDGITSTALMLYFFRQINFPVDYLLPHRQKDGYGLRTSTIDQIKEMGADLIITVDNGITSYEAIQYAVSLGIDVIITDHHLPEGPMPPAVAIINPNRTDSRYPFKSICGAVVAYKLVWALGQKLLPETDYKQFLLDQLDLITIGTIADVMPLRDENYALVKFGLKVLTRTKKPGLIELKKVAGLNGKPITPISVGYFLAPRLNASGRIEEADTSVKLLISESRERAQYLASYLDKLNHKRQLLQQNYLDEALSYLPKNEDDLEKVIIVENDDWHAGLIGLISGKLKERYWRPVLAFTKDEDGHLVGSARSIDNFHITNALTKFSKYFLNYGGHQKAAGLTIEEDKFPEFRERFVEYARQVLSDQDLIPEITIDSLVDIDQVHLNMAQAIAELGPFGEGNPEPLFAFEGVTLREMYPLSDGKHLKLIIQKGNQMYECIWWNSGEYKDDLNFGQKMDIAFRMGINNWRGSTKVQLIISDVRPSNNDMGHNF